MTKLAAKALRVLAARMAQEAEVLQRMARECLAEAKRMEKDPAKDNGRRRRPRPRVPAG
jgi:hypothetical protein